MQDREHAATADAERPVTINSTKALLIGWSGLPIAGGILAVGSGSFVPLAVAGACFAAASVFAVPAARLQWLWTTPTLRTDPAGLKLGGPVDFVFERASRRPVDVSSARLLVELRCEESISYEIGDSSTIDEHTVFKEQTTHDVHPTAKGLEVRDTVTVPVTSGAPTLRLKDHKITWYLQAQLDGAGLPNNTDTFEVVVVAELADSEPRDGERT